MNKFDSIKTIIVSFLLISALAHNATYAQDIIQLTKKEGISFRGIDSYKNHAVWVSGSKGTVGKSMDAGVTWTWVSPSGYEAYDFRDIEVFNDKEALLVNAGSPAVILRTADGGATWTEVYRDERPEIFFDDMVFNGKQGFVLGDPIEGLFQQLQTKDKGKTWADVSNFMFFFADEGEAAFAASGSSAILFKSNLFLGTGGSIASLFHRDEKKLNMLKFPVPIQQGTSSQGIFAIDFLNTKVGIAVGGDYMDDKNNSNAVLLTYDGGASWQKPETVVSGFRSAVKYITANSLVATGTSGTDISNDGGKNWTNISTDSYNSITTNKAGKKVYLTGSKGNVAMIELR